MTKTKTLTKRHFLTLAGAALATGTITMKQSFAQTIEKLKLSKAQWRERLTAEEFQVLRKAGTEPPHSSPLNAEHREGTYHCAGCDLPLFEAGTKYESGTGWPSFYDYIPGHLGFKTDLKLVIPRKEYHCMRCDGHQGHVFKDGPEPTGLRYCNNGVALSFVPSE